MESTKKELDQAVKTQSAEKKYNKSVEKNDPTDVQKGLHDNMVWEQTKSYKLGCETTAASNQPPSEKKKNP